MKNKKRFTMIQNARGELAKERLLMQEIHLKLDTLKNELRESKLRARKIVAVMELDLMLNDVQEGNDVL